MLHKILKWIDQNRFTVAAMILMLVLSGWLVGCQPKTGSVLSPGIKVTAAELDQEFIIAQAAVNAAYATADSLAEVYNQSFTVGDADLNRQNAQRQKLIEIGGGLITSAAKGTLDPVGTIVTLLGTGSLLAAVGLGADNVRKNRVIKSGKT